MREVKTYRELAVWIQDELKSGRIYGRDTYHQQGLNLKKEAAAAETHGEKMAAAARLGALTRRWHNRLIFYITGIALAGKTTSRTNVRHWQQAVFGKSCDSKELRHYADSARGPEVKIPPLLTDDASSQDAAAVFENYRDRLKSSLL